MSLKRVADEMSDSESKRPRCEFEEEGKEGEKSDSELSEKIDVLCEDISPILKLSDEMLLLIMRLLEPKDIISLGSTCRRLDTVIRDRTLWGSADLTGHRMMLCQMREFVPFLHRTTKDIATKGCVKLVEEPRLRWEQQCAPIMMFQELRMACPALESFRVVEHFYDARHVLITDFPSTLRKLSFEGCEVYFSHCDKSYFHGIHKHMVNLQELILDECQWLTPDALMALSKCQNLRKLSMKGCRNMGTCYAYISLCSRFGFKSLEVLDVRRSSLGDHEISCFQAMDSLTHLYVEVPEIRPGPPDISDGPDPEPLDPKKRKMCGPISLEPCCLCYATRTSEEDLERRERTKQEVPTIQLSVDREGNTVEFNFEVTLIAEDEFELHSPFVNADLAEQLDVDTLITDEGIMSLGSKDCVVLNSSRNRVEPMVVARNPNLTDLMILNCKGVTDLTLRHVAMMPKLKNLNVSGCGVSPHGVYEFRSQRPEVNLISDYCAKRE